MNQNFKPGVLIGVAASVALIVGLLIGVFASSGSNPLNTGGVNFEKEIFKYGMYAGSPATQIVNSSAEYIGTITTANLITTTGGITATGDIRIKSPVFTGSVATISGTSTAAITAAQVCDSNYATVTPSITAANTLTTPTAATLFADCLTTNGDEAGLIVLNTTASTTVVTAGASSTIYYDGATGGSATLAASSTAVLKFIRTSATAVFVIMSQYKL